MSSELGGASGEARSPGRARPGETFFLPAAPVPRFPGSVKLERNPFDREGEMSEAEKKEKPGRDISECRGGHSESSFVLICAPCLPHARIIERRGAQLKRRGR